LDPTIETPTSSLLRRTTNISKPKPHATQSDLAGDRVLLSNSLRLYIRHAWHLVEPSTVYLENWHIDLIAEHLEAVTAGQIKRLLINMPPRQSKSTCVSIMWPTLASRRELSANTPSLLQHFASQVWKPTLIAFPFYDVEGAATVLCSRQVDSC
jgi:hypothetical protein